MLKRRLQNRDVAPDFAVADLSGAPIRLDDYRGSWVLLSFYRYASCPLCNLRVYEVSGRIAGWEARGLKVIGVFQSPSEKIMQYVGRQDVPFVVLPDPQQKLYALYHVRHSWLGFIKAWLMRLPEIYRSVIHKQFFPGSVEGGIHRIPADFMIDPSGKIAAVFYGKDIGDHMPFEKIEAILKF